MIPLALFIEWPWLALVPMAIFAAAFVHGRNRIALFAALAWLAYFPYELSMKLRLLCTGECNIRVDLLLLYPVLLVLSAVASIGYVKFLRRSRPA